MPRPRGRRSNRFRKRDSDRSGFTYKQRVLIRDNGILVGPDEFDTPPPSRIPLGGEGEVNLGNARSDYTSFATPEGSKFPVQLIGPADQIKTQFINYVSGEVLNYGLLKIAASDSTTDITAPLQLSPGREAQMMSIECVSNNLILQTSNGLQLRSQFNMDSGSILNLIYTSGNSVWQETSRGRVFGSIGGVDTRTDNQAALLVTQAGDNLITEAGDFLQIQ